MMGLQPELQSRGHWSRVLACTLLLSVPYAIQAGKKPYGFQYSPLPEEDKETTPEYVEYDSIDEMLKARKKADADKKRAERLVAERKAKAAAAEKARQLAEQREREAKAQAAVLAAAKKREAEAARKAEADATQKRVLLASAGGSRPATIQLREPAGTLDKRKPFRNVTEASPDQAASSQPVGQQASRPLIFESQGSQQREAMPDAKTKPSVPASASLHQTHVVQKGETLWRISRTYKVKVEAIKEANGLSDNTIKIGQQLRIPTTNTSSLDSTSAPLSAGSRVATQQTPPASLTDHYIGVYSARATAATEPSNASSVSPNTTNSGAGHLAASSTGTATTLRLATATPPPAPLIGHEAAATKPDENPAAQAVAASSSDVSAEQSDAASSTPGSKKKHHARRLILA